MFVIFLKIWVTICISVPHSEFWGGELAPLPPGFTSMAEDNRGQPGILSSEMLIEPCIDTPEQRHIDTLRHKESGLTTT